MAFPRMSALAEVAWSPRESRNWDDFLARLILHSESLGYELRMGEGYVGDTDAADGDYDGPHKQGGQHYNRLAMDIMLDVNSAYDAATAITRLLDMGVASFKIAACLVGVVAQRLVRRICLNCKEPYEPSDQELYEHFVPSFQAAIDALCTVRLIAEPW